MLTFCDVLHETKQRNANKLSRVRSTDLESSLILPWIFIRVNQEKGCEINSEINTPGDVHIPRIAATDSP